MASRYYIGSRTTGYVRTEGYRNQKTSIAVGDIWYYDKERPDERHQGKLIYIKASLSDNPQGHTPVKAFEKLPIHVVNYARCNPDFPHESTADQFFDDEQFESYRALGEHLGYQAVTKINTEGLFPPFKFGEPIKQE